MPFSHGSVIGVIAETCRLFDALQDEFLEPEHERQPEVRGRRVEDLVDFMIFRPQLVAVFV